ncbi:MAG: carbohydrate binding family 9 domain-containing protein, partial [Gemmatimonadetes bacterium]|nr:carbohydrate binding family 9 domain-containing protein [Gemmatimonadota bacterium]
MGGRIGTTIVAFVAFAGAAPSQASAQTRTVPTVNAGRLSTEQAAQIRVDGLLDERAWRDVSAATDFRQQEPLEGAAATERTEVRVLFDETTLYIGVLAHDSDPDGVIARILQRDKVMQASDGGQPEFAGDDAIAILLDPFDDHRNGVVFATNPNGAEFDALLTDEGRQFNVDWRGVWTVAAQRTAEGWSAEFAIPFRSLRFPPNADRPWGLNVYRVIRRKNEEVLWSAWSRANEGFSRVSRAGHLYGLRDLPRAGMNLEVKPYALGGPSQKMVSSPTDPSVSFLETDGQLDLGLDVKFEIRPGILLDATLNTDFAQVEVDDEQ